MTGAAMRPPGEEVEDMQYEAPETLEAAVALLAGARAWRGCWRAAPICWCSCAPA